MRLPQLLAPRPLLPDELAPAWWAFLDCCDVLEGGRRILLGVLPVGRVEPAPIAVGTTALRQSLTDVRLWMPRWRIPDLEEEWQMCSGAIERAEERLAAIDGIAASTDELDHVLDAVRNLMDRLDSFADAEAAFRRRWRCPEQRLRPLDGGA
jgi:hypothetical protein